MLYIIAGVSGSGKTTLGKLLAKRLGLSFYDADDFHPHSNIEKMKSGQALTDEDRFPWLLTLHDNLLTWDKQGGAVLACSALKEKYRSILSGYNEVEIKWIFIVADNLLLKQRLESRKNHFFNPILLESQLKVLELPDYGLKIPADLDLEKQLDMII
ncbi:gluconate kinase, SKI family [Pseudopedobacter saltans DSM 12145]|uniref:Gluconokinase n=1 Tax=Pseudopedobacter saltans (strain ATCC 51119 / DSM 12145 / JCM 21818 / CCUG 39354 / LMG 10337 / NBRC 100064 / NCIMB 13643) TaxID=762903 RepID=F0S565_PSESL|nr:gluconokinase, GntK/IdnK-type [Pseudopedobacter saltans]ADY50982.1 gluconate kinase, SKI family [Pseudopedobacter saltans DSM 12145]